MKSVFFFPSGIKHEEKEEEEEEIPQFRNCECIIKLICFFFLLLQNTSFVIVTRPHGCSNECHYW